ncbi:MBL fold metallo-hydrolase [Radicibacter daui]|uniref:MBL fold metallo-hydrolase n=1 Tax=Radicibacter daui TaxID=3064829 RepID=UPI004046D47F
MTRSSSGPISGKSRNRYYSGPPSDHFDGERFFNPGGSAPHGLGAVLRWKLKGGARKWPVAVPSPHAPDLPPQRLAPGALRVSFAGHASFLIQAGGLNLLTDPVWSHRASPFERLGPSRYNAPGIAFDDLPPLDGILLSHGHYDHLDIATLKRLWQRHRAPVLTPLGNDGIIAAKAPEVEVRTADWGEAFDLGAVTAFLEPAHHWSARGTRDRNHALWGAFMLKSAGGSVYFAGDTGFAGGHHFTDARQRHGVPDIALLPIGAYEPRWFMRDSHMNPADAVEALKLLGSPVALGYHWGTFRLSDEGAHDPAEALAGHAEALAADGQRFIPALPGEVWQREIAGG